MHLRTPNGNRLPRLLVGVLTAGLLTAACGQQGSSVGQPSIQDADAPTTVDFPVTVRNCGHRVTFEEPPERVLLLESAPVPVLQSIGALDTVVMRAGAFPPQYYDAETNAAIDQIPSLGEEVDTSGHLQISQEHIIAAQPDVVLGLPDGISRESLAAVGIEGLQQPTYCPGMDEATTFSDVYQQVHTYGRIFDEPKAATRAVRGLKDRVESVTTAAKIPGRVTAAILFPTVGGGSGYAYGSVSMSHPQLEAAGFTNVFDDVHERVFEVTLEELIARDPDVLVLLHVDGKPGPVKDAVVSLPGAEQLTAVKNDDILIQLFNFTEPPTPLSVEGLERIAERFGGAG